jgi:putative FmdB family regulatory protein
MPVYEFLCRKCDKEFTLVLTIDEHERHDVKCPRCRSKQVEQAVSSVSVVTSRKS